MSIKQRLCNNVSEYVHYYNSNKTIRFEIIIIIIIVVMLKLYKPLDHTVTKDPHKTSIKQ